MAEWKNKEEQKGERKEGKGINGAKRSTNSTYEFVTNLVIKYNLVFCEKENLMNYSNDIVPYQVKTDVLFRNPRTLLVLTPGRKFSQDHQKENSE